MLTAVGGATFCSMALGAGRLDRAAWTLGHNVVLSLLFAVIFGVVGLCFLDPLLRLFGAGDVTLPYARDYMEVILWASPVGNTMVALNHFMRASGYPARAMLMSMLGVCVNLTLTPLFIFVFHWGIRGAAVATVIAQVVSLSAMLFHFCNKNSTVHFQPGIFRLRPPLVKSMLGIGLSPFLMNVCACLVILVINLSLRHHGGDLSIGAYGITNRLLLLFAMIIFGLTQGMQPIIGYNYGARYPDRVRQATALLRAPSSPAAAFWPPSFFRTPWPGCSPRTRPLSTRPSTACACVPLAFSWWARKL